METTIAELERLVALDQQGLLADDEFGAPKACDTKQGAAYGYTRQLGLHPLLATRADTGEVLHARMRKGSAGSGRGAQRFVRETIGRVRRAGATGKLVFRADSGFWSRKVITACVDHHAEFSITVPRHKVIRTAIGSIDDVDWVDIAYTDGGVAQVAEATRDG
jgi:hypothetical protein